MIRFTLPALTLMAACTPPPPPPIIDQDVFDTSKLEEVAPLPVAAGVTAFARRLFGPFQGIGNNHDDDERNFPTLTSSTSGDAVVVPREDHDNVTPDPVKDAIEDIIDRTPRPAPDSELDDPDFDPAPINTPDPVTPDTDTSDGDTGLSDEEKARKRANEAREAAQEARRQARQDQCNDEMRACANEGD